MAGRAFARVELLAVELHSVGRAAVFVLALAVAGSGVLPALVAGEAAPDVLVIDDFETGIARWANQDTGKLEWVDDAAQGKKALRWTAADDGLGHIVFKALDRRKIDFSRYQLLTFRVKVEGKPVWNINPIVQQYPSIYGYRGLYYSIDTLHPFGKWFTYSQVLKRWENAWPDTFSRTNQEFQFEIHQLAGAGATRVYLDDIRLMKNPLAVNPSYPGRWSRRPDGSQVTVFDLPLNNSSDIPLTVRASVAEGGTLDKFEMKLPPATVIAPSGKDAQGGAPGTARASHTLRLKMEVPASVIEKTPAWYGETARIALTVEEIPGLVLYTDLAAGTKPRDPRHPSIFCTPQRMRELQALYKNETTRKRMGRQVRHLVSRGGKELTYKPPAPRTAATGVKQSLPEDKHVADLVKLDGPNLPFAVDQDPATGQAYCKELHEAHRQGHLEAHMTNAGQARSLGLAYLVSGRREFAEAAARIMKPYGKLYLELPLTSISQASPAASACSGSTRIGGTYMREDDWPASMAVALDCIRPAGVLTERDLDELAHRVFGPSANNMMDHKVGAMNLQWMIQSSSLMAGLAAELPGVTARAMHDSHGIVRLCDVGFLDDGNWWENPSYQNVAKIAAYPALIVGIYNGLVPWDDKLQEIFKASYKLYGPDGTSPTLGTGGKAGFDKDDAAIHALAPWITDPELAWVVYNRKAGRAGGIGLMALFRDGQPAVPPEKTHSPIPDKTTIAVDYGGISMRVPGTDRYCYVHYGRELTHGHRNKLSINAYGKGGWYVRNVAGGYGDDFKDFLETIASSTSVMIDGKDADSDTGELLFHKDTEGLSMASAREVGAWKNVEHERSVVLTEGPLIVIDRVLADREHRYDWLYHSRGTRLDLVRDGFAARAEPLGETRLYGSLFPDGVQEAPTVVHLRRKNESGLKIALADPGRLFSFRALEKRPSPGLLWRRQGKTLCFAAVYWPYAKGEDGVPRIERLPVTEGGQRVGGSQGGASPGWGLGGILRTAASPPAIEYPPHGFT